MAQFIGFSNIFGGLIDQIPNYLERFSSFMLDLFRNVVGNPIGFMAVFISVFIANYSIDSLFNTIVNDLNSAVDYVSASISNFISTITLQSCGVGDIACYVYNAFAEFSKYLLQGIYIAFLYPITYVIGAFLQFISYVIKMNMYLIQSTLCYVANTWFPPIAGTYVAFKGFESIGSWLFQSALGAIHNGSLGKGLLGILAGLSVPLLSFVSVNSLVHGLLTMVESVFNINCSNIKPPTLNITVQVPQIGSMSRNTTESLTYSLLFSTMQSIVTTSNILATYGVSGSLATYDLLIAAESPVYALSYSVASTVMQISAESGSYLLNYAKAPYTELSSVIASKYSLTTSVLPPLSLSSKESSVYGLSFSGVIKINIAISELTSYSLMTLTPITLKSNVINNYKLTGSLTGTTIPPESSIESASYSLTVSNVVSAGSNSTSSGTTITLTYGVTLEGIGSLGSNSITTSYTVSDNYSS